MVGSPPLLLYNFFLLTENDCHLARFRQADETHQNWNRPEECPMPPVARGALIDWKKLNFRRCAALEASLSQIAQESRTVRPSGVLWNPLHRLLGIRLRNHAGQYLIPATEFQETMHNLRINTPERRQVE
jgi:hypothetical protein